jgi:hypothetical protein
MDEKWTILNEFVSIWWNVNGFIHCAFKSENLWMNFCEKQTKLNEISSFNNIL